MTQFRSAWIEWVGQTALARTRMSQELLQQAAEQQRRFAANAVQTWVEQNARVMEITIGVAQDSLSRFTTRSGVRSDAQKSRR